MKKLIIILSVFTILVISGCSTINKTACDLTSGNVGLDCSLASQYL